MERLIFSETVWDDVPAKAGVYVIYDLEEVMCFGMAGRNGNGSLRNRLKDHSTGQIVNMFAQHLFLDRVHFIPKKRVTHPREAKSSLSQVYKSGVLSLIASPKTERRQEIWRIN